MLPTFGVQVGQTTNASGFGGRGFDFVLNVGARIHCVGPPPTNSAILGIYKDHNIISITSSGHY